MIITKNRKKYWESLKGKKPKNMEGLKLGWGWMKGKHHTKKTIDKISETKKKNPTRYWLGKKNLKVTGENHWNWKGGKGIENTRLRHSEKYKIWQIEVFKKDYFRCQDCGKHCGKDIIAHHLKRWSDFPKHRFDVKNGVTLCRSCHKKRHNEIGMKTRYTLGDNTKAGKLLNWKPKIDLEKGLKLCHR